MKARICLAILATALTSTTVSAQEANLQCEMISALTGDYYAQRLEGKTKEEIQQATPPEFVDSEFLRVVDLAINLAFSFETNLNEDKVETQVYDSCLRNQR